ncbi:MAG: 2-phospho-L-lactate guanylyltransferase [Rudaea sp.]
MNRKLKDSARASLMAVVPVKPFAEAKRRLAEVLDEVARSELSHYLMERTLGVLSRVDGIDRVLVISRDPAALQAARRSGAWSIWESGSGLNSALEQATRIALANGADSLLVVPADLPFLTEQDVVALMELGPEPPCLVIAPADRDQGTNALLSKPAGLFRYAFGESSYAEHCRRAERAGAQVQVCRSDGIAFDLDLPEDWERVRGSREWPSIQGSLGLEARE